MRYEIRHSPSFSLLEIQLSAGEQVVAEAGAMVYMRGDLTINTRTRRGGLLRKLQVSLFGGESLFINEYTAQSSAKLGLAAPPLGDIVSLEVAPGRGWLVQLSAYIASHPGVELDTQWQGFKGLFGHGLLMLKATGEGAIFINSFGAVDRHSLSPGERMTVDNFHLVAFSDTCQYSVKKFGSLKSALLGGEGLVTEVSGPGEIYIQTRSINEFAQWVSEFLPTAGPEEESESGKGSSGIGRMLGGLFDRKGGRDSEED
jgi:uncharacterized protein (TIGR00266 family)